MLKVIETCWQKLHELQWLWSILSLLSSQYLPSEGLRGHSPPDRQACHILQLCVLFQEIEPHHTLYEKNKKQKTKLLAVKIIWTTRNYNNLLLGAAYNRPALGFLTLYDVYDLTWVHSTNSTPWTSSSPFLGSLVRRGEVEWLILGHASPYGQLSYPFRMEPPRSSDSALLFKIPDPPWSLTTWWAGSVVDGPWALHLPHWVHPGPSN